jgi:hypothetical protein
VRPVVRVVDVAQNHQITLNAGVRHINRNIYFCRQFPF